MKTKNNSCNQDFTTDKQKTYINYYLNIIAYELSKLKLLTVAHDPKTRYKYNAINLHTNLNSTKKQMQHICDSKTNDISVKFIKEYFYLNNEFAKHSLFMFPYLYREQTENIYKGILYECMASLLENLTSSLIQLSNYYTTIELTKFKNLVFAVTLIINTLKESDNQDKEYYQYFHYFSIDFSKTFPNITYIEQNNADNKIQTKTKQPNSTTIPTTESPAIKFLKKQTNITAVLLDLAKKIHMNITNPEEIKKIEENIDIYTYGKILSFSNSKTTNNLPYKIKCEILLGKIVDLETIFSEKTQHKDTNWKSTECINLLNSSMEILKKIYPKNTSYNVALGAVSNLNTLVLTNQTKQIISPKYHLTSLTVKDLQYHLFILGYAFSERIDSFMHCLQNNYYTSTDEKDIRHNMSLQIQNSASTFVDLLKEISPEVNYAKSYIYILNNYSKCLLYNTLHDNCTTEIKKNSIIDIINTLNYTLEFLNDVLNKPDIKITSSTLRRKKIGKLKKNLPQNNKQDQSSIEFQIKTATTRDIVYFRHQQFITTLLLKLTNQYNQITNQEEKEKITSQIKDELFQLNKIDIISLVDYKNNIEHFIYLEKEFSKDINEFIQQSKTLNDIICSRTNYKQKIACLINSSLVPMLNKIEEKLEHLNDIFHLLSYNKNITYSVANSNPTQEITIESFCIERIKELIAKIKKEPCWNQTYGDITKVQNTNTLHEAFTAYYDKTDEELLAFINSENTAATPKKKNKQNNRQYINNNKTEQNTNKKQTNQKKISQQSPTIIKYDQNILNIESQHILPRVQLNLEFRHKIFLYEILNNFMPTIYNALNYRIYMTGDMAQLLSLPLSNNIYNSNRYSQETINFITNCPPQVIEQHIEMFLSKIEKYNFFNHQTKRYNDGTYYFFRNPLDRKLPINLVFNYQKDHNFCLNNICYELNNFIFINHKKEIIQLCSTRQSKNNDQNFRHKLNKSPHKNTLATSNNQDYSTAYRANITDFINYKNNHPKKNLKHENNVDKAIVCTSINPYYLAGNFENIKQKHDSQINKIISSFATTKPGYTTIPVPPIIFNMLTEFNNSAIFSCVYGGFVLDLLSKDHGAPMFRDKVIPQSDIDILANYDFGNHNPQLSAENIVYKITKVYTNKTKKESLYRYIGDQEKRERDVDLSCKSDFPLEPEKYGKYWSNGSCFTVKSLQATIDPRLNQFKIIGSNTTNQTPYNKNDIILAMDKNIISYKTIDINNKRHSGQIIISDLGEDLSNYIPEHHKCFISFIKKYREKIIDTIARKNHLTYLLRVIDPLKVIDDLECSEIKIWDNSENKIKEDPIRILCGIKLLRNNFIIPEEIKKLFQEMAYLLRSVKGGILQSHLKFLLTGYKNIEICSTLIDLDIVNHIFPGYTKQPTIEDDRLSILALLPKLPGDQSLNESTQLLHSNRATM